MNSQLLSTLKCPISGGDLTLEGGQLRGTSTSYPLIDGIPWLFSEPDYALHEWATKIQQYLELEKLQLKYLQQQSQACELASTKKRLSAQHQARHKNLALIEKTLKRFLSFKKIPITVSTQQIHSYFDLFFRDWCWGHEELNRYVEFALNHRPKPGTRALILGSGAGGLSYRLSQAAEDIQWFSVEHNPFLALSAEHIMAGKSLKLQEIRDYPDSLQHTTEKWDIKVDKLRHNNHQCVLCAFPALPFEPESFDLVIAPWFLDILDTPFPTALNQAIRFLKNEGKLVFFGPANIHKKSCDEQLTHEEIEQYIAQYFSHSEGRMESIYYLDSPHSSQRREEQLYFMVAEGVNNRQDTLIQTDLYADLKLTPQIEHYRQTIDVHLRVLKHVHGSMSVDDLAGVMERELGIEAHESRFYAAIFIRQVEQLAY